MKYLFIFISFLLPYTGHTQSTGKPVQEKQSAAEEKSVVIAKKQNAEQSELRAANLLNSYINTEQNKALSYPDRASALSRISDDALKMIAGTWQFHLIQFLQSNKRDRISIEMAMASGNKKIVLPYAVQFAIINNDRNDLLKYTAALDSLVPIERNAFVYHYNTLMSANTNATIYARGLLDLVPLAVLQQQHNIRKDVHLKYYEGEISENENAYLCLSIGKDILLKYPSASFTGLLIKIKGGNTINELEKHVFSDFDLTNFTNEYLGFSREVPNTNYLPGFLLLYKYYQQQRKDTKALENLIEKIRSFYGLKDPL